MKPMDNLIETLSPEYRLMLAVVSGDAAKIVPLLAAPIRWKLFLELAIYHQIHPSVYKTLMQLGNPTIPSGILNVLRDKCRGSALQALCMTAETIRLVNCLESSGISVIVPKGASIASYLYSDITMRPSGDIDLIVLHRDMKRASSLLESNGYCRVPAAPEGNLTHKQLEIYAKIWPDPEHISLIHRQKKILVELQYNLGHCHQVPLTMPSTDHMRRIQVAGSSLPVLNDEEWLLYLVSHGSRHNWCRLRWLVDIARFMQRGVDWETLDLLAKRLGARSILRQGLILANRLLTAPLSPNYQSMISSDRQAWRLSSTAVKLCIPSLGFNMSKASHNYYMQFVYRFGVSVGWKNKLSYVSWLCRPTSDDIAIISLPPSLYFLYYVLRPYTLLYMNWARVKARYR